jgi:GNAT superfamily N-acetyltransferase
MESHSATLSVRMAEIRDAPNIIKMAQEFRAEFRNTAVGANERFFLRDAFEEPRRLVAFVAEIRGHVGGYISAQSFYEPSSALSGMLVCDLYVSLPHRNQGLGRALIQGISEYATTTGGRFLLWYSDPNNQLANNFYAKVGAKSLCVMAHTLKL